VALTEIQGGTTKKAAAKKVQSLDILQEPTRIFNNDIVSTFAKRLEKF
jgi:hypothetical protein